MIPLSSVLNFMYSYGNKLRNFKFLKIPEILLIKGTFYIVGKIRLHNVFRWIPIDFESWKGPAMLCHYFLKFVFHETYLGTSCCTYIIYIEYNWASDATTSHNLNQYDFRKLIITCCFVIILLFIRNYVLVFSYRS